MKKMRLVSMPSYQEFLFFLDFIHLSLCHTLSRRVQTERDPSHKTPDETVEDEDKNALRAKTLLLQLQTHYTLVLREDRIIKDHKDHVAIIGTAIATLAVDDIYDKYPSYLMLPERQPGKPNSTLRRPNHSRNLPVNSLNLRARARLYAYLSNARPARYNTS
ncbi:hypothetical protein E2C01_028598 [Portunus trituberculatus]|uniref:Uncharacterized protein n=1 Tax=Portunus trituberculatus TaxID=210409 RepID=A0A5B7EKV8_PORTR|nr:hypothetical protein [Portunus trituberculatus]